MILMKENGGGGRKKKGGMNPSYAQIKAARRMKNMTR